MICQSRGPGRCREFSQLRRPQIQAITHPDRFCMDRTSTRPPLFPREWYHAVYHYHEGHFCHRLHCPEAAWKSVAADTGLSHLLNISPAEHNSITCHFRDALSVMMAPWSFLWVEIDELHTSCGEWESLLWELKPRGLFRRFTPSLEAASNGRPPSKWGHVSGVGYYSSRLLMSSKKLIEKFTDERLGRTLRTVITITICTLLLL